MPTDPAPIPSSPTPSYLPHHTPSSPLHLHVPIWQRFPWHPCGHSHQHHNPSEPAPSHPSPPHQILLSISTYRFGSDPPGIPVGTHINVATQPILPHPTLPFPAPSCSSNPPTDLAAIPLESLWALASISVGTGWIVDAFSAIARLSVTRPERW